MINNVSINQIISHISLPNERGTTNGVKFWAIPLQGREFMLSSLGILSNAFFL